MINPKGRNSCNKKLQPTQLLEFDCLDKNADFFTVQEFTHVGECLSPGRPDVKNTVWITEFATLTEKFELQTF